MADHQERRDHPVSFRGRRTHQRPNHRGDGHDHRQGWGHGYDRNQGHSQGLSRGNPRDRGYIHGRSCSRSRVRGCHHADELSVPSVPQFEVEFIKKVGGMTWKTFLQKKNSIFELDPVLKWDDSAAREAFYTAKARFEAAFKNLPSTYDFAPPDPDMYNDKVNWDEPITNPEVLSLLESAARYIHADEVEGKDGEEDGGAPPLAGGDGGGVRLEDIVPTGWDVDLSNQWSSSAWLTGLIVGSDGNGEESDEQGKGGGS